MCSCRRNQTLVIRQLRLVHTRTHLPGAHRLIRIWAQRSARLLRRAAQPAVVVGVSEERRHARLLVVHAHEQRVGRYGDQRARAEVRAVRSPRALPQPGDTKHLALGEPHEVLIARTILVQVWLVEAAHHENATLAAAPGIAIARSAAKALDGGVDGGRLERHSVRPPRHETPAQLRRLALTLALHHDRNLLARQHAIAHWILPVTA